MGRTGFLLAIFVALLNHAAADTPAVDTDTALSRFLGVVGGSIDKPFGDLYQGFKNYKGALVSEQYAVPIILPDGRSLQKNKTDFKDPRLLLGNPELFIGYAPKAKQLEVISLNSRTGEYDFYIVKNYGKGLKSSIAPADRALCMTCHQNGGPIFSRGPWDESTLSAPFNHPDGTPYRDKSGRIYKGNELYQELEKATEGKADFDGIPLGDISVTSPSAFDARVRTSASLLQRNKVCRTICLNDAKCTEALLHIALGTGKPADLDLIRSRVDKLWPSDDFGYPSSVLANRDPLKNRANGGTGDSIVIVDPKKYRAYLEKKITFHATHSDGTETKDTDFINGDPRQKNSLAAQELRAIEYAKKNNIRHDGALDVTYDENVTSTNANFASGTNSLGTPDTRGVKRVEYVANRDSDADPAKPRPFVGKIAKSEGYEFLRARAFECLFAERERLLVNKIPASKLPLIVEKLPLSKYAIEWPKDRNDFFGAVVKELKIQGVDDCCRNLTNEAQQPIQGANKMVIEKVAEAAPSAKVVPVSTLFDKYCARCHRGDEIQKLPLEKMETLRTTELGKTALDLLSKGKMPPKNAVQPSAEERQRMVEILK